MSVTVVFPDFSPNRDAGGGPRFLCTLHIGDLGPAWVNVVGGLGISNAWRLARALRLTDTRHAMVVLDLRELTSIDLFGAHVIVLASVQARRAHRRLVVIAGSGEVNRILGLTGAIDLLDLVDLDSPELCG